MATYFFWRVFSALIASVVLIGFLFVIARTTIIFPFNISTKSLAQEQVQNTLLPRFIDFDIGTATVRGGASHQVHSGIPDLAPYVLMPNVGFPLTMVNFALPPDYASGSDIAVQIVWDSRTPNCFHVLQAELVGFGPRSQGSSNAALFESIWPDETEPSEEGIIQVGQFAIEPEFLSINFRSTNGFPAYPGDAMTLTITRDSGNINDTCTEEITFRSISVIYQGNTVYMPLITR